VIGFYENDIPISIIAKSLKISELKVLQIIEEHKKSWLNYDFKLLRTFVKKTNGITDKRYSR
jgi:predicted DNA-binding protein YlxM (UPF0122 family)